MSKKERLKVSDLESVAQVAIKAAFQQALAQGGSWLTAQQEAKIFREVLIEDDKCTFEVCTQPENVKENSRDPLIVARTVIDRYTGEIVGTVDVYLPPVLASDLSR